MNGFDAARTTMMDADVTDAGVDGYISERLQGAPDHPMTRAFPEGEYLKGLVVVKVADLLETPKSATISG